MAGDDTNVYIGSAYGKQGLQNRTFHNHLNARHRARDPYKALYKAMDSSATAAATASVNL